MEDILCAKFICKTWEKDTNGLFDYYSKETSNFKSSIYEDMELIRNGHEVKEVKTGILIDEKEDNIETLFNIKKQDKEFIIENNIEINMEQTEENINKINDKLWYVVHQKNKRYYLLKNDIIKLGRIKYLITEESINSGDIKYELSFPDLDTTSNINKQNLHIGNPFNLVKEVKCLSEEEKNLEEKILCKFCYAEEADPFNNPMIHLCNCKGYLNYAHFNCIKYWMSTKIIKKENDKKTVMNYFLPQFNCEICKVPFPFKFRLNRNKNKIYELIDIERPNCNYIILESLNQKKENNENHKFIHVIKLINEDDITIGRANNADIKINDISVSRLHAKLNFNFDQKSVQIVDLKSKFGSLVLIKDKIELKSGECLIAQVGRTLFGTNIIKNKEERKEINIDEKCNKNKSKDNEEGKTNEETNNENFINNNLEKINKVEEKKMMEDNIQNDDSNDNNVEMI